jgi:hypothetical protein
MTILGGKYTVQEVKNTSTAGTRTFMVTGKRGAHFGGFLFVDGRTNWVNMGGKACARAVPAEIRTLDARTLVGAPLVSAEGR